MKEITIKTEYITLGQLLKYLSIVGSGGEAKMFLMMNDVYVNNEVDDRRGRKVYPGDVVKIDNQEYNIKKYEA